MKEFATDYRQLNNDDLLQLWVERSQLVGEAKEALREEIRTRGIGREAELAVDRRADILVQISSAVLSAAGKKKAESL